MHCEKKKERVELVNMAPAEKNTVKLVPKIIHFNLVVLEYAYVLCYILLALNMRYIF